MFLMCTQETTEKRPEPHQPGQDLPAGLLLLRDLEGLLPETADSVLSCIILFCFAAVDWFFSFQLFKFVKYRVAFWFKYLGLVFFFLECWGRGGPAQGLMQLSQCCTLNYSPASELVGS